MALLLKLRLTPDRRSTYVSTTTIYTLDFSLTNASLTNFVSTLNQIGQLPVLMEFLRLTNEVETDAVDTF